MNQKKILLVVTALFVATHTFLSGSDKATNLEEKIKLLEEQINSQKIILEKLKAEVKKQAEIQHEKADEMDTQIKSNNETFKSFSPLKGLEIGGDMRLRYEVQSYDREGKATRNRYRMRFRMKIEKKFTNGFHGYFRLASGSVKTFDAKSLGSMPDSTNQTFTDSYDEKPIWIDQAAITWTPPQIAILTLGGGKFKNPFKNTWMVWDGDVNPEGFFQQLNYKKNGCTLFLNFAQTMLKENKSGDDSYMLGYQGGMGFDLHSVDLGMAVAYYDYHKYAMNFKYAGGNPITEVDGVEVLDAGDFNILDILGSMRFKTIVPINFLFDYAKNLGENSVGTDAGKNTAWMGGIKFGQAKYKKSWEFGGYYAYIEPNSVVGIFNDSDFGHANKKGLKFGFKYCVADNIVFASTFFHTDTVWGYDDTKNMLQVDLVYNF